MTVYRYRTVTTPCLYASDRDASRRGLQFVRVEEMTAGTRFLCPYGDVWTFERRHTNHWAYSAVRERDGHRSEFAGCATRPVLPAN